MLAWLRDLDALLRGQRTLAADLVAGRLQMSLRTFVPVAVVLGAGYGFFMGWFAVFNREPPNYQQLLASTVKLPALFLLTLVVTFPSLYVFNALVGCRLTWGTTLRLLVGAVVVNLAVAASFGPILGFFTFSTTSYPFMILLNVVLLGLAGFVGLTFLMQVLRRTVRWQTPSTLASPADVMESPAVPLAPPATPTNEALGQGRFIFQIWVIIYGLVGAQMGWLLRPFIGNPSAPFTWFRDRDSNFFEALGHIVQKLIGQ